MTDIVDVSPKPPRQEEVYLGDAVYASFDGFQIRLRTGDGNNQTIYLDPHVMENLISYKRGLERG